MIQSKAINEQSSKVVQAGHDRVTPTFCVDQEST